MAGSNRFRPPSRPEFAARAETGDDADDGAIRRRRRRPWGNHARPATPAVHRQVAPARAPPHPRSGPGDLRRRRSVASTRVAPDQRSRRLRLRLDRRRARPSIPRGARRRGRTARHPFGDRGETRRATAGVLDAGPHPSDRPGSGGRSDVRRSDLVLGRLAGRRSRRLRASSPDPLPCERRHRGAPVALRPHPHLAATGDAARPRRDDRDVSGRGHRPSDPARGEDRRRQPTRGRARTRGFVGGEHARTRRHHAPASTARERARRARDRRRGANQRRPARTGRRLVPRLPTRDRDATRLRRHRRSPRARRSDRRTRRRRRAADRTRRGRRRRVRLPRSRPVHGGDDTPPRARRTRPDRDRRRTTADPRDPGRRRGSLRGRPPHRRRPRQVDHRRLSVVRGLGPRHHDLDPRHLPRDRSCRDRPRDPRHLRPVRRRRHDPEPVPRSRSSPGVQHRRCGPALHRSRRPDLDRVG